MLATLIMVGLFAAVVVGAATDPRNRLDNPNSYKNDDEYWGL